MVLSAQAALVGCTKQRLRGVACAGRAGSACVGVSDAPRGVQSHPRGPNICVRPKPLIQAPSPFPFCLSPVSFLVQCCQRRVGWSAARAELLVVLLLPLSPTASVPVPLCFCLSPCLSFLVHVNFQPCACTMTDKTSFLSTHSLLQTSSHQTLACLPLLIQ